MSPPTHSVLSRIVFAAQVYVWILNNDQEFQHAFTNMGATGVMTDYPTLLQNYLASNKHDFLL